MKSNEDKLIMAISILFIVYRVLCNGIIQMNKLTLYFMDTISICSMISLITYTINIVKHKEINYEDIWIINYLALLLTLIVLPETSISIGLIITISVLIIIPLIIIPFLYFTLYISINKIYLKYDKYSKNKFIIILICIVLNLINIAKSIVIFKTKL